MWFCVYFAKLSLFFEPLAMKSDEAVFGVADKANYVKSAGLSIIFV